jgi:uncharacterized protein (DUF1800 family)
MASDPGLALRGIHRFGLGPRPGDLARIGGNIREVLRAEIATKQVASIAGVSFASIREAAPALRDFSETERMQRETRVAAAQPMQGAAMQGTATPAAATPAPAGSAPPAPARQPPPEPPLPQRTYREEVLGRFHVMLEPLGGLPERLVAFWSNHFAVSVNKGNTVRTFAGLLEREAIRPHVHGRFADMLLTVETHPAMIFFLDQQQSLGPNSRAGARRGRGLNENLAREIMELHTLGVAGGYTQADVTALAHIITGWTLAPPNGQEGIPGTFRFNANMHEPGEQLLLGKRYGDGGFERGKAALADLARHPSTAQHIARKLTRHFVADEPPASMVARLAKVFRDTDGDLQALSFALLDSPEAWSAQATKMRSPQEFLVASARALGRKPEIGQILGPLNAMGHPIWQPGGPNGFPDSVAAWASPEGLKTRLDVSAAIARQSANSIDPKGLVEDIFGPAASTETRQAILRAETRYQAVAIALMAPEFQRR